MNAYRHFITFSVVFVMYMGFPGFAHADSQSCELVGPDVIVVDGLIDDWRGLRGQDLGGKDQDTSFTIRCAYDDQRLHMAVDVRDEYLFRSKQAQPSRDDNLVIELAVSGSADSLRVYPGSDKVSPRRQWNGKAVPAWLQVEDTQQRRGWSVEVSIPLARLRGYGKGAPGVKARIEHRDADFAGKTESRLAFDGSLELAATKDLYRSFLKTTGLAAKDIKLDRTANIDDTPGPERVIVGGKILGVLSTEFAYMELPVRSPRDVLRVALADLRGDGTMSVMTELRQHGNGGSRDIVVVWQVVGNGQFEEVLAVEVRKALGDKVLVNRWSLVPRGKFRKVSRNPRSKKGHDLLIEVGERDVTGWDEDSYNEVPASDVRPILTPWSEQTSAVYYFEGNAALGGEPRTGKAGR